MDVMRSSTSDVEKRALMASSPRYVILFLPSTCMPRPVLAWFLLSRGGDSDPISTTLKMNMEMEEGEVAESRWWTRQWK